MCDVKHVHEFAAHILKPANPYHTFLWLMGFVLGCFPEKQKIITAKDECNHSI